MLTERDLLETIEECKTVKHPTAATCQLMASCYTILDHLFPKQSRSVDPVLPSMYSTAQGPTVKISLPQSQFVIAAQSAGEEKTLKILDEHMQCIKVLFPKEYNAVINKLQAE